MESLVSSSSCKPRNHTLVGVPGGSSVKHVTDISAPWPPDCLMTKSAYYKGWTLRNLVAIPVRCRRRLRVITALNGGS